MIKKVVESTHCYYGARYYDPKVSVWLSVDPKANAFPDVSPYAFNMNNPVMMIDPGGDSIFVTNMGSNQYEVVDAEVQSGYKGIYEVTLDKDGKRTLTGNKIGESLPTHSFVNDEEEAVAGAIINLSDKSGQSFIDNEIIEGNPGLYK